MIARLLRHFSASYLAKHGNHVRRTRDREFIRATARAMNVDMGRAIPEALR